MCAVLMDVRAASTEDLKAAIARKMNKFGSLLNMPLATRRLVVAGQDELEARANAQP